MEDKMFEAICQECSKPFETPDEDAEYCPDCWAKLVSLDNEGIGEDSPVE